MLDKAAFAFGLRKLARMAGRALTPEDVDDYYLVLGRLTEEQWALALKAALESDSPFMPTAGQLLAPFRRAAEVALDEEAAEAFRAITDGECTTYSPYGSRVDVARVMEKLGPRAQYALIVAGGSRAFEEMSAADRPHVLRRFTEAYRNYAGSEGARAALPAGAAADVVRGLLR